MSYQYRKPQITTLGGDITVSNDTSTQVFAVTPTIFGDVRIYFNIQMSFSNDWGNDEKITVTVEGTDYFAPMWNIVYTGTYYTRVCSHLDKTITVGDIIYVYVHFDTGGGTITVDEEETEIIIEPLYVGG